MQCSRVTTLGNIEYPGVPVVTFNLHTQYTRGVDCRMDWIPQCTLGTRPPKYPLCHPERSVPFQSITSTQSTVRRKIGYPTVSRNELLEQLKMPIYLDYPAAIYQQVRCYILRIFQDTRRIDCQRTEYFQGTQGTHRRKYWV